MAFALKCAWKRRGILAADQPAINLSIIFHLSSTRSTCSSAAVSSAEALAEAEALAKVATRLRLLVHLAEFTTILPNES